MAQHVEGRSASPSDGGVGWNWDTLLTSYISLGFDPATFWSLNPKTHRLRIQGANKRLQREHNGRMVQAYWTALLPNMKNPPKLKDLLSDEASPRRVKSWQEMKAALAIALG